MNVSTGDPALDRLYAGRPGRVDVIDVPALACVAVEGRGAPESGAFADAVQALYAVSYSAHFLVRNETGKAPKVMPLEALWWVDDEAAQRTMHAVADGTLGIDASDRDGWCWRAQIVQLAPIDTRVIAEAIDAARRRDHNPALEHLEFECWVEGPCVQVLHVGPYAEEQPSIVALHACIAERGYAARGRHHEIYLSDPRRTAPSKLRTLLRQPIEPVAADALRDLQEDVR